MDCRHIDHRSRQGKVNSSSQMSKSAGLQILSDWMTGSLQTAGHPNFQPHETSPLFYSENRDFTLLESQSRTSQATCINFTVFNGEDCRYLPRPLCIRRRTVLSGIAFDCRHSRNSRGQTARMQE